MNKINAWVGAARLRTLPLSISGIIVGSVLGDKGFITTTIFWLAIATTLALQILSNFANDYGDGVKGTDNEDRIGPMRALQAGTISKKEMTTGILFTIIISIGLIVSLIYTSFGKEHFMFSLLFFILGSIAIIAAIKYTMSSSAYGYKGLGDLFVFIFFGLVSVLGCCFLFTKEITGLLLLPAIAIGALSSAVLNLNNMRDYVGDKKANKNTVVVKIGVAKAKKYHFLLIITAIVSMVLYTCITYDKPQNLLFLIAFIPLLIHVKKVHKTEALIDFDPELKKVALATFLLAILFSIGLVL